MPAVAAALLATLYLAVHAVDARRLERANQLGLAGSYEEAAAEARRVSHAPAETRALQVQAVALTALGRYDDATAAWVRLVGRDPNSWIVHLGLARTRLLAGDAAGARAALARARQLNPRVRLAGLDP